ncbi:4-hydroxy-tetrahydrodipicolinate reductase [Ancylomarina sp. 16SWW S1-10-2]|uniref:4-hydroxy-tetrahydrodipicolinate reductase n=1 Tax=Ancylomarina sp. 16SWW S1-10-2 TaxID=2499681 RepID=UPI0012AE7D66|nr:4-hydroxy-tetrahydrodipicolinate reductase [Ancylomarina sp. 16SWW S1-10-2]MRT94058.1 4-hydroxy-tetrahydrodipicolinate reductase [Ancylomarina sp. 16SWW S1-10-2]
MKIALIGYGKMGHEIERIALDRNHEIALIIDQNNQSDLTVENLKGIDVVIEFTNPDSAYNNYMICFEAGVPVVSGTTGWLDQIEDIKSRCDGGKSFFYASNFSLGVNLFFELNKKLAQLMTGFDQYDVDMEEIHHIHKLDSPSGTALTLAEGVFENNPVKDSWIEGLSTKDSEMSIVARRHGAVPGTHSITWHSEVDEIQIQHKAYSRKGFAFGAVLAAEFMPGKTGFFGMKDLLKL